MHDVLFSELFCSYIKYTATMRICTNTWKWRRWGEGKSHPLNYGVFFWPLITCILFYRPDSSDTIFNLRKTLQDMKRKRRSLFLLALRDLCDLINAFHWMPASCSSLSGKLTLTQSSTLGCISSAIFLYFLSWLYQFIFDGTKITFCVMCSLLYMIVLVRLRNV